MADPFIGEICMFAGNFAPRNFAFCNGQTMPVAQNAALFAVFGTLYGGDGEKDFGVPNLQGRVAVHAGHGPGLTNRRVGSTGGSSTVTLIESQLPSHNHSLSGVRSAQGDNGSPSGNSVAAAPVYAGTSGSTVSMSGSAIGIAGDDQAHQNCHPYLALNFIVSLAGATPVEAK